MLNFDESIKMIDKAYNDLENERKNLQARINQINDEQLRLQGEYRCYMAMKKEFEVPAENTKEQVLPEEQAQQ